MLRRSWLLAGSIFALAIGGVHAVPSAAVGEPSDSELAASILSATGKPLTKATVVAETPIGEPLRATHNGGALWLISGVGQKTVLHLQDPQLGATRAEITLPAEPGSQALVNVYWGSPLAEARIVTVIPESSPAALTGFPTVSPPHPTGGGAAT